MNKLIEIVGCRIILLYGILLYSCQKDVHIIGDMAASGLAKVNVIDAVVTGGNAKVNVSTKQIYWNSLPNNVVNGGQVLGNLMPGRLFRVPADRNTVMQVVPVNDTTQMWYNNITKLNAGKVYSLYLSGTPENIKALFHEEIDFPKYIVRDVMKSTPSADSIVNIRFINLSPSGPKVDINIQEKNTLEAKNLNYQAFTNFKTYPAKSGIESIKFEIRKSSDKSLVTTYDLSVDEFRFKSVVIFIMGIYDPEYQLPIASTDRYQIMTMPYQ